MLLIAETKFYVTAYSGIDGKSRAGRTDNQSGMKPEDMWNTKSRHYGVFVCHAEGNSRILWMNSMRITYE